MKLSNIQKTVLVLAVTAAITRIAPHYPNFTAMGALAFMGGQLMRKAVPTLAVAAVVLFGTDFILNNFVYGIGADFTWFYAGSIYTFLGLAAYGIIGLFPKSFVGRLGGITIGAVAFFLLSNFGAWISSPMLYPATSEGLVQCYIAGLPYFLPEFGATLIFSEATVAAAKYFNTTAAQA